MRTWKQIAILLAVVLSFGLFDASVYLLCTRRCLPEGGEIPKARVIQLDQYLPFDDQSKIVPRKADLGLTEDLPVIDGAEGLYPVFSAVVNALYPADSVQFDGENFTPDSRLQMRNTLRAYRSVVDGDADLIFCAAPSAEQLDYARQKGVELELVPIGQEAFVFLVNQNNPVDSLTVEQVRGIYHGTYTNWRELGGRNAPISALQRLPGSGSQTALLAFMQGQSIAKDYDSFLGSAIGFSFRYYVADVIENGGVKMLALDGVYPSKENIASGQYPVVSQFYAIYRKDNSNPNIPKILDWLLSDDGQSLMEQTGYARLS